MYCTLHIHTCGCVCMLEARYSIKKGLDKVHDACDPWSRQLQHQVFCLAVFPQLPTGCISMDAKTPKSVDTKCRTGFHTKKHQKETNLFLHPPKPLVSTLATRPGLVQASQAYPTSPSLGTSMDLFFCRRQHDTLPPYITTRLLPCLYETVSHSKKPL